MRTNQPLMRRVVIAFVVMTVLVSGIFSLGIVAIVHQIEEHLVTEDMYRELHTIIDNNLRNNLPLRLDADTRFFASNVSGYEIPAGLAGTPEGFSEFFDGERAFYVFAQTINGRRYLLTQDQHEFEAHEQVLFDVVLAGFVLSVLGAWGLGWLMARKAMMPVSRLARQVRNRDQLLPAAHSLAADYADDEVGQLAAAFDDALGQLRCALERERMFTSDVSHELRTALMVISSSCEVLQQEGVLASNQRAQVSQILRASHEMQDLVQTFLQLSRSKSNETVFGGDCPLYDAAREQADFWGALMMEKGLEFGFLAEEPDAGRYNATLLRTVLSNLLRNAWHYTDKGFVRLILFNGGFRVEDSGVGVPEQQHGRIFEPFVRGSQARGEGLGLGLSLVKRICEHQGWMIVIEGNQPTGSCFSVTLNRAN